MLYLGIDLHGKQVIVDVRRWASNHPLATQAPPASAVWPKHPKPKRPSPANQGKSQRVTIKPQAGWLGLARLVSCFWQSGPIDQNVLKFFVINQSIDHIPQEQVGAESAGLPVGLAVVEYQADERHRSGESIFASSG